MRKSNTQNSENGLTFLAERGLNIFSVLDCATLPPAIGAVLTEQVSGWADYARLVIIGHGGKALWRSMGEPSGQDPVDHYATSVVRVYLARYQPEANTHQLYPGGGPVPLLQLGRLAGICAPSWIGINMHPCFGSWFAFRVLFLTTAALLPTPVGAVGSDATLASPCEQCVERPCLSACPAGAIVGENQFDLKGCSTFRLPEHSPCASGCAARRACPVGADHQYDPVQERYHAGASLKGLQRQMARLGNPPAQF